jgi:hypothetical protein
VYTKNTATVPRRDVRRYSSRNSIAALAYFRCSSSDVSLDLSTVLICRTSDNIVRIEWFVALRSYNNVGTGGSDLRRVLLRRVGICSARRRPRRDSKTPSALASSKPSRTLTARSLRLEGGCPSRLPSSRSCARRKHFFVGARTRPAAARSSDERREGNGYYGGTVFSRSWAAARGGARRTQL